MPKQDRWPLGARVKVTNQDLTCAGETGMLMAYHNSEGQTRLRIRMDRPSQGYARLLCEDIIIISPECPNCGEYVTNSGDYVCNMCRWKIDEVYEVQTLHSSVESVY